jgi:hypothetical protein
VNNHKEVTKMRRGCIAVGAVRCDGCQRLLEHGERYVVIDSDEGKEQRFCTSCSLSRGYASYKAEKEGEVITFFPRDQS